MITFWIVAALLITLAVALLLPPLLGTGNTKRDAISRDAANIAILRNQLNELDTDLASGTLQQEQYELAHNELQKRVLEEVKSASPQLQLQNRGSRTPAILLGLAIPAFAVGLYFLLGNPQALSPAFDNSHEPTQQQIEVMVNRLAQRMEQEPNDRAGWVILARSYNSLGRFSDAANAYSKLAALEPQDADVLVEWADTLAVAQGRNFDGQPEQLIKRALALDPNHPKGLALAGNIAFVRKDYANALKNWQHMMRLVPSDSQLAQAIAPGIAQAQSLADPSPQTPASKAAKPAVQSKGALTGKVEIDPALRMQVAESDTVFIFVRAVQGPPMPLVALRKQVRDLPLEFTFNDAASLSADRKLSSVAKVVVVARISKTGDTMTQTGDIEAVSAPLAPTAKNVRLRLARP